MRKQYLLFSLILLALWMTNHAKATLAQGIKTLSVRPILEDDKDQVHFPFLHRSDKGDWYLAYRRGEHGLPGGDRSAFMMSSDQGHTWQPWRGFPLEQKELTPNGQNGDTRVRLFRLLCRDGALLSHRYVMENPRANESGKGQDWDAYVLRSVDDGANWKLSSAAVEELPFLVTCGFWGHFVELSDGMLLAGVYGASTKEKGGFSCGLVASHDGGAHWKYLTTIASDLGSEGPNELDLALLANGELLCVFRTGGAAASRPTPLYYTRSADGGKEWTEPQELPNSAGGVSPQLLRVGDVVLLVYGLGRLRITAQLTKDGQKWTKQTVIYEGPGSTYTDLQLLDDNQVQVVFDESLFLSPAASGGIRVDTNRILRAVIEITDGMP